MTNSLRQSRTKEAIMTATLKLQTIHCAKTGISLVNCSDSKGIDTLNALLKEGRLKAGNNAGNIFLSEDERAKLKAAKQWNGTNFRWCYRDKSGAWHQFEGWTIGQHNIQVLKDLGFEADKTTLSKGQVFRRQYVPIGTVEKKSPKETIAVRAPSGPMFGGSNPPKETVQSSPKETVCDAPKEPKWEPKAMDGEIAAYPLQGLELGKQGGHQSYVSRMMSDCGLTQGQAKALWAEARRHFSRLSKGETSELGDPSAVLRTAGISMSRESRTLIYGDQPKAETLVEQFDTWVQPKAETIAAPKEPKVHSSEGTTVPVKPEALAAFLSGMEGAVVVGFADGNALVSL